MIFSLLFLEALWQADNLFSHYLAIVNGFILICIFLIYHQDFGELETHLISYL